MASRKSRHLSPERRRLSAFWLLGIFIVPVIGWFAKIEIVNPEKLPDEGAFVLAPNHYSELDPLIIAVSIWRLGRAPRFMAKESLFHVPVLGAAMRSAGMVPVARSSSAASARQTIETSRELVEHGRGLIVYPEGTLTRDPDLWPMRGKSGAVRLALTGDIPLIPMVTWGVQEIMPRYGKLRFWPPRKRVRILFGDPVDVAEFRGAQTQPAVLNRATDKLMGEIAHLLAELRGTTPPLERWNPGAHGQNETGRLES